MSAIKNTPAYSMSFEQVMDALKARFGGIDKIELYEATNDVVWQIQQLADAITNDGISLHKPMFEMDGDTIKERCFLDGRWYNLSYTVWKVREIEK